MSTPDQHDFPLDTRELRNRLLLAVAGVGLGCAFALPGLQGAEAAASTARTPAIAAPAVVRTAAEPMADGTRVHEAASRRPAIVLRSPHAPSPRRWSGLLGFDGATLGSFDDLTFERVTEASPNEPGARATADATPEVAPEVALEAAPDAMPDATPAPGAEPFVVMIDPGHGGTDPGSVAPNGLLEKELTADIAERTRRFLSEVDGVEVRLTREGDTGLSRQGRVDRIRDGGADLVVSLHFNHLPQADVTLVESFYAAAENIEESRAIRRAAGGGLELVQTSAPDLSFTEGSERLATLVQRRVHGEVAHGNADAIDAGVKRETLFVLTRSLVPGALVELTCLSNPDEAERLEDGAYRDRLAAALADAVRDYRSSLETRPLGSLDT